MAPKEAFVRASGPAAEPAWKRSSSESTSYSAYIGGGGVDCTIASIMPSSCRRRRSVCGKGCARDGSEVVGPFAQNSSEGESNDAYVTTSGFLSTGTPTGARRTR